MKKIVCSFGSAYLCELFTVEATMGFAPIVYDTLSILKFGV
ncbi:hypothetical protein B481_0002 [Planococcus halocryophilus Or1]|nr:hypothetical protein B481_0002 [Planococcus halocryophilus Or1]